MTDHIYTTNREIERARALWEKGILLAERTEGFYTLKHFNVAMKVTTFSDTDRLQPYLEDISLEGLFN
jgi:hypothetical protein